MKTQKSQESYLMVDHRFSPGLPEDVALLSGYDPKQVAEGKLFEAAGLTCSHCKVSVVKNLLRTRPRASCAKCGYHYICDLCDFQMQQPGYSHIPFEQLIELGLEGKLGSPPGLLVSVPTNITEE